MECDWLRSYYSQTSHGMRISVRVFFILKWSIVDLQFFSGVQQSDSVIYIYITEYWVEFPVLYSRSSLAISFIYSIVCVLSRVQLFANPWTFTLPSFSVHGIFQARVLEWVTLFSSRESSQPRGWTLISCIGRQILYHWATWEALYIYIYRERESRESEVTQSCLTLCDPVDCSLPGSSIHGILKARILKWVAISFSRGSSRSRNRTPISHIAGRRFTLWATREAYIYILVCICEFQTHNLSLLVTISLFTISVSLLLFCK